MKATEYEQLKRALRRKGYNLVKRFVVSELCRSAINYKGYHELWRATHTYKEALTPKELARLELAMSKMEEVHEILKPMMYRLRLTGHDGHGYDD